MDSRNRATLLVIAALMDSFCYGKESGEIAPIADDVTVFSPE